MIYIHITYIYIYIYIYIYNRSIYIHVCCYTNPVLKSANIKDMQVIFFVLFC